MLTGDFSTVMPDDMTTPIEVTVTITLTATLGFSPALSLALSPALSLGPSLILVLILSVLSHHRSAVAAVPTVVPPATNAARLD